MAARYRTLAEKALRKQIKDGISDPAALIAATEQLARFDREARRYASRKKKLLTPSEVLSKNFKHDNGAFDRVGALKFAAFQARTCRDDRIAFGWLKLICDMEGWLMKPADPKK